MCSSIRLNPVSSRTKESLGYSQQAGPEGSLWFGRGLARVPPFSMLFSGFLALSLQVVLCFLLEVSAAGNYYSSPPC